MAPVGIMKKWKLQLAMCTMCCWLTLDNRESFAEAGDVSSSFVARHHLTEMGSKCAATHFNVRGNPTRVGGLAAWGLRGCSYCLPIRLAGGSDSDEAAFRGEGAGEFHDWDSAQLHEEDQRRAYLDGNDDGPPSVARSKQRVKLPSMHQDIPPQEQQMMSSEAQQGPDNEQARLSLHIILSVAASNCR